VRPHHEDLVPSGAFTDGERLALPLWSTTTPSERPRWFVLDTSLRRSAISASYAAMLGVAPAGGPLRCLQLANEPVGELNVQVVPDGSVVLGSSSENIVGLLGMDFFHRFDLDLDLQKGIGRAWPSGSSLPRGFGLHDAVEIELKGDRGLIEVDARLRGTPCSGTDQRSEPLRALVDLGQTYSACNWIAAQQVQIFGGGDPCIRRAGEWLDSDGRPVEVHEADLGVELPGRVSGVLQGERLCSSRLFWLAESLPILERLGRFWCVPGLMKWFCTPAMAKEEPDEQAESIRTAKMPRISHDNQEISRPSFQSRLTEWSDQCLRFQASGEKWDGMLQLSPTGAASAIRCREVPESAGPVTECDEKPSEAVVQHPTKKRAHGAKAKNLRQKPVGAKASGSAVSGVHYDKTWRKWRVREAEAKARELGNKIRRRPKLSGSTVTGVYYEKKRNQWRVLCWDPASKKKVFRGSFALKKEAEAKARELGSKIRRRPRLSGSTVTGVSYNKRDQRWRVLCWDPTSKKQVFGGYFAVMEEAEAKARELALKIRGAGFDSSKPLAVLGLDTVGRV
ncbi:unnamed protein product, partial [Symbiodinium sp. KB8]